MKKFYTILIFVLFCFCTCSCVKSDWQLYSIGDYSFDETIVGYRFVKVFDNWNLDLSEEVEVSADGFSFFNEYNYSDKEKETELLQNNEKSIFVDIRTNQLYLIFWIHDNIDIPETLEITLTRTDKGEEITEQYTLDFTQKPKFS